MRPGKIRRGIPSKLYTFPSSPFPVQRAAIHVYANISQPSLHTKGAVFTSAIKMSPRMS